jgi:type II secretory pathway component PulF
MSSKKIFPVLAVEMIGVGEESGNLEDMLDQVSTTYENEVKQSLGIFLAIFEPLLILSMVGVIAILAIGILVPIFNLNSQIDPTV